MRKSKRVYLVAGILVLVSAVPILLSARFLMTLVQESSSEGIPILMYHRVVPEARSENRYELRLETFEHQLRLLSQAGYRFVSLEALLKLGVDSTGELKQPIILTFDDGTVDHYQYVFPLLREYGFVATFFVVTEWIGDEGILSEENIVEMKTSGMSFGSHTHTHRFLDQLDSEELTYELRESKKTLEEILNEPVDLLAIPGGWYNENVLENAENIGYRLIYTSNVGTNPAEGIPFLAKRIEVSGDLSLLEFIDLWSPSVIARKDTKRMVKIIAHKFLGSSRYATFGRISIDYTFFLVCGVLGLVLLIVIVLYIRNCRRSHGTI